MSTQTTSDSERGASPLRIEQRDDGVAVVWFDVPGEKVNTLKSGFEKHFEAVLEDLGKIDGLKGVVLASDVKQMEMALGLRYWFWGGLCAGFSALVLVLGGWYFVRPAGSRPTAAKLRTP